MEEQSHQGDRGRPRVALVYDERMCNHWDPLNEDHPESPERIRAIWDLLQSRGIPSRCVVLNAKEAEDKYIRSVHTQKHINLIRNISSKGYDLRDKIALSFNSIYFNDGSSKSAYLAAGSVIEVSEKVAKGEFSSAVAIVRPPGHHAEHDKPMGFCLFNNVAIAASYILNESHELGIKKILIVDWDVHHGNGTQKMFWKDPRVLFFSVHRYDFGTFYPTGDDGSLNMVGEGLGAGYNINVPWEHGQCGDADYIAVWDHVLLPVASAYNPDMILISGGFDAAIGDPLGGCCVTPYGYSIMMKKLMEFAGGKVVMALEGGYNLDSMAKSVLACVEALLEDKPILGSLEAYPFESTWRVIRAVREELSSFWPSLNVDILDEVPPLCLVLDTNSEDKVINAPVEPFGGSNVSLPDLLKLSIHENHESNAMNSSHLKETLLISSEGSEMVLSLNQKASNFDNWRPALSKINVWYCCYGSSKARFLCYIKGGQVEGMQNPCPGSRDPTLPNEIKWKTVPHRLFFGRSNTSSWGTGGAAFLCPESNSNDKAYVCMYKITLEQFNDILLQGYEGSLERGYPLFGFSSLDFVMKNKCQHLEELKDGWYSNVVFLGMDSDLPILTVTCSLSDFENFRTGNLPTCAPSEDHAKTIVRDLVEGKQLSETEAFSYIHIAASRPL